MKKIVAVWPREPRTKDSKTIALFYATILVVLTVAQLLSLEKFISLMETFQLPGYCAGRFIAVALVVGGVFALPFLLRMKLSTGMRWLSMVAGWIVPALWVIISLWVNVFRIPIDNAGYLGANIHLLPGWWMVCIAISLAILAAWSSWGLWPRRQALLLERNGKK